MEQQSETEVTSCAHHWVLDSSRAMRLPREAIVRHPNCIGRPSVCKKCGSEKIHYEKVWDQIWRE